MIKVNTIVNKDVNQVWDCWTLPEHITKWCQASEDWHAPFAENDLRVGGKFTTTMAAKDGSFSFDFSGIYTKITLGTSIDYTMEDGRRVEINFTATENGVEIVESFDPETENPEDMQQAGWQAILNNFKKYVEAI